MDIVIEETKKPGNSRCDAQLLPQLHQLPCSIDYEGPAPVSTYFSPRLAAQQSSPSAGGDGKHYEVSLRGRGLEGVVVDIPCGYQVVVLEKARKRVPRRAPPSQDALLPEEDQQPGGYEGSSGGDSQVADVWSGRPRPSGFMVWGHDHIPSASSDKALRALDWIGVASLTPAHAVLI
ncbi:hypothetical protein EV182_001115 [Spiromyces aspiralis]|uniref:Uncharacterized protein n=1 Tax=Spiromyces aspiralis TaxID=68401 RepID=A0ACC1HUE4_9FUNG|nr:hypothetical protein EV182_001115 [Spiromyces aspiralis]